MPGYIMIKKEKYDALKRKLKKKQHHPFKTGIKIKLPRGPPLY